MEKRTEQVWPQRATWKLPFSTQSKLNLWLVCNQLSCLLFSQESYLYQILLDFTRLLSDVDLYDSLKLGVQTQLIGLSAQLVFGVLSVFIHLSLKCQYSIIFICDE